MGALTPSNAEDSLCRFYTKPEIGKFLVRFLGRCSPARIVDLGAGGGALTTAAGKRWTQSELVTVDIDKHVGPSLQSRLQKIGIRKHLHYSIDALSEDLPSLLSANHSSFDVAICNPPYIKLEWKKSFETILYAAGLQNVWPTTSEVNLESVFFAQNLRLTSAGGKLGLIVPDSLISGFRSTQFRQHLIQHHRVERVVQLPRNSFKATEAQAFILILQKDAKSAGTISLEYLDPHRTLQKIQVDQDAAVERMDYQFHLAMSDRSGDSLRTLGANISRGVINSAQAKNSLREVFHVTDFPSNPGGRLRFSSSQNLLNSPKTVTAKPGDILIARVGRNLQRKIALVERGASEITDCVYRIRLPRSIRNEMFAAMASEAGRNLIAAAARGVGATMLSKKELLKLSFGIGRKNNGS